MLVADTDVSPPYELMTWSSKPIHAIVLMVHGWLFPACLCFMSLQDDTFPAFSRVRNQKAAKLPAVCPPCTSKHPEIQPCLCFENLNTHKISSILCFISPDHLQHTSASVGKIQTGARKRGLKPQIFRENRGEILPAKSGLFGANWDLFRAYRGLFGADRDQFLPHPTATGEERKLPRKGPFWPNWSLSGQAPLC